MGLLAKYHDDRKVALTWWRGLNTIKQKEAVSIWQEQLSQNDTVKNWTFEMVSMASSKVVLMYEFFNKIV